MIKIGIITIVKVNNYGAELQAFALQYKLNLIGYDAEIIDYLFYKNERHISENCSKPFYPYPLKLHVKELLLPIIESFRRFFNRKAFKSRENGFLNFHKRNTKFSKVCYRSYSELYRNPPLYDVYCVGSDQVWNPACYTNLSPYLLSFAPCGKKKISYASSFGVKNLPSSCKSKFSDLLKQLDYISVREDDGVRIIQELTKRQALKVADPTLLLTKDEWLSVADYGKVPNYKYILIYVLKDSDYIRNVAIYLSKKYGFRIVRICKNAFKQDRNAYNILNIIDASPADFIGLFAQAEIVITNSFHGTVFSILFQKNFYTIIKSYVSNNSRQISLMKTLEIDRIKYEDEEFIESEVIQWENVHHNLDIFRTKSINYLIKAINE